MNVALGTISVLILTMHFVGTFLNWYQPDNSYDNFMHILAGFWLGLVVLMMVKKYSFVSLTNAFLINCLLIASLTLTIGVFWEFFEFSLDYLDRYFYNVSVLPANVADTLGDLLFDFVGAFAASVLFLRKTEK